ncbi:hypothetical protein NQ318_020737 [Aromia moschata]|uniref:BHLH domain-containing protein n=1 Tax=Aromia moschata TaxID=1265417 RepID=A0AAV8YYL1_9CUCU|nr:hypothetical protein NQ318_020737 [Aromia moschata]
MSDQEMLQFDDELSQRLGLSLDSNNNGGPEKAARGDKYSLRPRSMRRRGQDAEDDAPKSRSSKAKQKAAPLSKYRRKTANARERSRMREINQAFETLRQAVPQVSVTRQQNEKLTKITTLRLAMKTFFSDCSELDCFLLESDGESLPLPSDFSDHSLTPADFSVDFADSSLTSIDFSPLSPDLSDHLSHFDPFLSDFS